jgi:hypothetical protein
MPAGDGDDAAAFGLWLEVDRDGDDGDDTMDAVAL